ncbi:MAG: hypothetical protein Q9211_003383, partial [Gyalolechia sp. 1 TL-2023]
AAAFLKKQLLLVGSEGRKVTPLQRTAEKPLLALAQDCIQSRNELARRPMSTMVPLRPGQLGGSRVGVVLSVPVVAVANVRVVRFPDGTVAVTETLVIGGSWKMVEFSGYAGNSALGLVDVDVVRVGIITELRLPIEVGNPEEGRVETLPLPDGIGKPIVGRGEMLELADRDGNPKLALGPVTGGARVVEFKEMLGVKLGTEYEVSLSVGAMVGPVPDEPKRVERESDELEVVLGSKPLGPDVPTLLGPVLSGTAADVFVLGIGVGITERVDETVTGPGLPALVRNLVVVPEVTKTVSVVSWESRPLMVRVYIGSINAVI